MTTPFLEALARQGWAKCDKSEYINTAPSGSATFRRGPVRVELAEAYIAYDEKRCVVMYYHTGGGELVLSALVVDPDARRKHYGAAAVASVIELAKGLGYRLIRLEPSRMARKYQSPMDKEQLGGWYERLGFTHVDGAKGNVMEMKLQEGQ